MKHTFFVLALLIISSSTSAYAEKVKAAHTEVELIAEVKGYRPGMTFRAGVHFKMDPDWHIYWKNPGDSGMTPSIKWQVPNSLTVGDLEWPAPVKIDLPPLSSYGYEGEVLLAAPIKVSTLNSGENPLILKARVEWLACKVECIPGQADLELMLPVGVPPRGVLDENEANQIESDKLALFLKTRGNLPVTAESWNLNAWLADKKVLLKLDGIGKTETVLERAWFFSENSELVEYAAQQILKPDRSGYTLEIPLALNYPKNLKRLQGVLAFYGLRSDVFLQPLEIDIPLKVQAEKIPSLSLRTALLFAFLGGLILNLMPCVLPVLSIKILSLVNQAAGERKNIFKHGLAFTVGVLISFWILAGILIALQTAGRGIGWGFQLQSPAFVAALAVLFFVLSLNLFGFFEIGLRLTGAGQNWLNRGGLTGSFAGGILAVVVATPCTAPFMGTALGYALTQPSHVAFLIFTALGLGLSMPYLLLCMNTHWTKWIPKPGPWMVGLKKFFGLLLLLTSLWLLWIFSIQTGIYGKFFSKASKQSQYIVWEKYSEKRLNELLAQNKPVFVDFTAAWCLTCKVNERVALERADTGAVFKDAGIVALKADWTSRDPEITQALARYGRNSIPFYLLYTGKSALPIILPEIITPQLIAQAVQDAGLQKQDN